MKANLELGNQWVQLTEALWPGSVVRIWAVWKRKKKQEKKCYILLIERTTKGFLKMSERERDLRAENSNGVLSTEGNETRSSPRDVVDDSVASCSYEHSLRFHFGVFRHLYQKGGFWSEDYGVSSLFLVPIQVKYRRRRKISPGM